MKRREPDEPPYVLRDDLMPPRTTLYNPMTGEWIEHFDGLDDAQLALRTARHAWREGYLEAKAQIRDQIGL